VGPTHGETDPHGGRLGEQQDRVAGVSPDGARVLAADRAVPAPPVELARGRRSRTSRATGRIVAVAFSPTGRQAASGGRRRMMPVGGVQRQAAREVGGHPGLGDRRGVVARMRGTSPRGTATARSGLGTADGQELQEPGRPSGKRSVRCRSRPTADGSSPLPTTRPFVWDVPAAVRAAGCRSLKLSDDELNSCGRTGSNDRLVRRG